MSLLPKQAGTPDLIAAHGADARTAAPLMNAAMLHCTVQSVPTTAAGHAAIGLVQHPWCLAEVWLAWCTYTHLPAIQFPCKYPYETSFESDSCSQIQQANAS
jgi:hypothetical protein